MIGRLFPFDTRLIVSDAYCNIGANCKSYGRYRIKSFIKLVLSPTYDEEPNRHILLILIPGKKTLITYLHCNSFTYLTQTRLASEEEEEIIDAIHTSRRALDSDNIQCTFLNIPRHLRYTNYHHTLI